MVALSTAVALFLGFFEFWLVIKSEILGDTSAFEDLKLFPSSFLHDRPVHLLVIAFTLFLGLLRISWAVSGRTVWSWLCVILTHVIEAAYLWNLALCPHWNTNNLSLPDLVQEILAKKHDIPSSVLLFLVPGFVLFFLLCGPNTSSKKTKKD
jgi:ABC-type long-subunit fatty acid transport system fused permease/ATPase subunit